MFNHEKTKIASLGAAIITLCGLLIVIINQHALFPDVLFYSLVSVFTVVIASLVFYTILGTRVTRYFEGKLWKRKRDKFARMCFDDFKDFVERFASLGEFESVNRGITGILDDLISVAPKEQGIVIRERIKNAGVILQKPLTDFRQRLGELRSYYKEDINYEFLSSVAREFENYVRVHKSLYVDFAVIMAREIGLEKVKQQTKTAYADYKDDYNQFIIFYTNFAKEKREPRLGIFSQTLTKANEL